MLEVASDLGTGEWKYRHEPKTSGYLEAVYIPVEVVVSGGGSSVVGRSGRCAAFCVTAAAAEDPVSLSPEVSEEDVSVMATEDLVAT